MSCRQCHCCSMPRPSMAVLSILEGIRIEFVCVLMVRTPPNCPHSSPSLKLTDINLELAAHGLCRRFNSFAVFELRLPCVPSLCLVMYALKTHPSGAPRRYSNGKVFAECPVLNTLDTSIRIRYNFVLDWALSVGGREGCLGLCNSSG